MGVSTVFSLIKIIEREGRTAAVKRVLKRGVLLFTVALIHSGGFNNPWPDVANGFGELVIGAVSVTLFFWFERFLYQRKIFLRLRLAIVAVCHWSTANDGSGF